MAIEKYEIAVGEGFEFAVHPMAQPLMAGTLEDGKSYLFFGLPDEAEDVSDEHRLVIKGVATRSGEANPLEEEDSHWGYLFSWIDGDRRDWHIHLDITDQVKEAEAQARAMSEAQAAEQARAHILAPNGAIPPDLGAGAGSLPSRPQQGVGRRGGR